MLRKCHNIPYSQGAARGGFKYRGRMTVAKTETPLLVAALGVFMTVLAIGAALWTWGIF